MAFGDFLNKYVLADGPTNTAPKQAAAPQGAQIAAVSAAAQTVSNEFITALRNAVKGRATAFTALLAAADKLTSIMQSYRHCSPTVSSLHHRLFPQCHV
jgi:hypothetical protein